MICRINRSAGPIQAGMGLAPLDNLEGAGFQDFTVRSHSRGAAFYPNFLYFKGQIACDNARSAQEAVEHSTPSGRQIAARPPSRAGWAPQCLVS
jgi:hypothetical protein